MLLLSSTERSCGDGDGVTTGRLVTEVMPSVPTDSSFSITFSFILCSAVVLYLSIDTDIANMKDDAADDRLMKAKT